MVHTMQVILQVGKPATLATTAVGRRRKKVESEAQKKHDFQRTEYIQISVVGSVLNETFNFDLHVSLFFSCVVFSCS